MPALSDERICRGERLESSSQPPRGHSTPSIEGVVVRDPFLTLSQRI